MVDRLVVVGGVAAGTTAVAVRAGLTSGELENLDLAYAPPYSTAVDVPLIAGNLMSARLEGKVCGCSPEGLE